MTKKTDMMITPVDIQAQNEGTWKEYHGVQLKIGRSNNPIFKAEMLRLQAENASALSSDSDIRESASVDLLAKAMSRGLLFDWQDHPNEIPYSVENAEALLRQDEDCRTFVLEISNDISNYYKENVRKTLEK